MGGELQVGEAGRVRRSKGRSSAKSRRRMRLSGSANEEEQGGKEAGSEEKQLGGARGMGGVEQGQGAIRRNNKWKQ